jgi:hypothetical protein
LAKHQGADAIFSSSSLSARPLNSSIQVGPAPVARSTVDALYLREGDDADLGAAADRQFNDQAFVVSHLNAPTVWHWDAITQRRVL